jgi:Fic family protein
MSYNWQQPDWENFSYSPEDIEDLLFIFTEKAGLLSGLDKAILNERQLKCIQRMLQEGPKGFEGGMTAKKYMRIIETSKAKATRDLSK